MNVDAQLTEQLNLTLKIESTCLPLKGVIYYISK